MRIFKTETKNLLRETAEAIRVFLLWAVMLYIVHGTTLVVMEKLLLTIPLIWCVFGYTVDSIIRDKKRKELETQNLKLKELKQEDISEI